MDDGKSTEVYRIWKMEEEDGRRRWKMEDERWKVEDGVFQNRIWNIESCKAECRRWKM